MLTGYFVNSNNFHCLDLDNNNIHTECQNMLLNYQFVLKSRS